MRGMEECRPAECRGGGVRHLDAGEHSGRGDGEVEVGEHLGGGRAVHAGQAALARVVRVQRDWPRLQGKVTLHGEI